MNVNLTKSQVKRTINNSFIIEKPILKSFLLQKKNFFEIQKGAQLAELKKIINPNERKVLREQIYENFKINIDIVNRIVKKYEKEYIPKSKKDALEKLKNIKGRGSKKLLSNLVDSLEQPDIKKYFETEFQSQNRVRNVRPNMKQAVDKRKETLSRKGEMKNFLFPNLDDTFVNPKKRNIVKHKLTGNVNMLNKILTNIKNKQSDAKRNLYNVSLQSDRVSSNIVFSETSNYENTMSTISLVDTLNFVFDKIIENMDTMINGNETFKMFINTKIALKHQTSGELVLIDRYINDTQFYNLTKKKLKTNTTEYKMKLMSRLGNINERFNSASDLNYLRYSSLEIIFAEIKPLTGSSYMPLPNLLINKGGIINFRNNDNYCLLYAIYSSIHNLKRGDEGMPRNTTMKNDVKNAISLLSSKGYEAPYIVEDVREIGFLLNIWINIFVYRENIGFTFEEPIENCDYYAHENEGKKVVNILYYENITDQGEVNGHYVWIKNFNALFYSAVSMENQFKLCYRCKQPVFGDYIKHVNRCNAGIILEDGRKINSYSLVHNKNNNDIVEYKKHYTSLMKSTVIYADFESISIDKHIPTYGYVLVISKIMEFNYQYKEFYGDNFTVHMLSYIEEMAEKVVQYHKTEVFEINMTMEQEKEFKKATHCYLCKREFNDKFYKVRDHDHDVQHCNYRGAACNSCNLKYTLKLQRVSVVFHNFKGYDSHIITHAMNKNYVIRTDKNKEKIKQTGAKTIKIIADSSEKFKSVQYGNNLQFIDSMSHMNTSLEKWSESLMKSNNEFMITKKFINSICKKMFNVNSKFTDTEIQSLFKKQFYLYKYIEKVEDYEKAMPTYEQWKLEKPDFTKNDYDFVCMICQKLNITNYFDYTRFYGSMDVFILADCFESLRKISYDVNKIDPAHYISAPGMALDCFLKSRKSENPIKLLSIDVRYHKFNEINKLEDSWNKRLATLDEIKDHDKKLEKLRKDIDKSNNPDKCIKLLMKYNKMNYRKTDLFTLNGEILEKDKLYKVYINNMEQCDYLLTGNKVMSYVYGKLFEKFVKIMEISKEQLEKERVKYYNLFVQQYPNNDPNYYQNMLNKNLYNDIQKIKDKFNLDDEDINALYNKKHVTKKNNWNKFMKMMFIDDCKKIFINNVYDIHECNKNENKLNLYMDIQNKYIRGAVSQVCSSRYEKVEKGEVIEYIDVNSLYPFCMTMSLPTELLEPIYNKDEIEQTNWLDIANDDFNKLLTFLKSNKSDKNLLKFNDVGYLIYCKSIKPPTDEVIQDKLKDYPLFPNKRVVDETELSNTQKEFVQDIHNEINRGVKSTKIHYDKSIKTICDFLPKENYISHYIYVAMAIKLGYQIEVDYIIPFKQSQHMKDYVETNYSKRLECKANNDDIGSNFYKVNMLNSLFGKTLQNVLEYKGNSLLNADNTKKYIQRPSFNSFNKIHDNLYYVDYSKEITLNQPHFIGGTILELSKTVMSIYWHFILKNEFNDDIKLLYTDTDSFIYKLSNDNQNKLADLDKKHTLFNNIILGCFKKEYADNKILEYIGMQSKCYALKLEKYDNDLKGSECKKLKGYNAKNLNFEQYRSCIEKEKSIKKDEIIQFVSKGHQIYTMKSSKVSLSNMDYKSYIMEDGITQIPYGHYSTIN